MGLLYDIYVKQHGRVLGDIPDWGQKREVRDFPEEGEVVGGFVELKSGY